jgi:hypothetical protein
MISDYTYEKMQIGNFFYEDDLKIIDGEVIPFWRRKKPHTCDVEDVQDLIRSVPNYIVIGTGFLGLMQVTKEAFDAMRAADIYPVMLTTEKAVKAFNELLEKNEKVVAAFHLAC